MASQARSSEIARAIRRLLARPAGRGHTKAAVIGPVASTAVMGGFALMSLAPAPADAAGLGEARTASTLGQPLRATVPLRLAAGQTVRPGCVTTPLQPRRDLRGPAGTRVRTPQLTGPGVAELQITSDRPLYEPLYELTLKVDCPGLPRLMRHYVLMLDLPGLAAPAAPVVAPETPRQSQATAAAPSALQPAPRPRRATPLRPSREPIPAGQRYRVRDGDTLSTIAARIEGRAPNTTWQLADKIFAANPQAFIGNNPDLIKLGFEITIPDPVSLAEAPVGNVPAQPPVQAAVADPPVANDTLLPPGAPALVTDGQTAGALADEPDLMTDGQPVAATNSNAALAVDSEPVAATDSNPALEAESELVAEIDSNPALEAEGQLVAETDSNPALDAEGRLVAGTDSNPVPDAVDNTADIGGEPVTSPVSSTPVAEAVEPVPVAAAAESAARTPVVLAPREPVRVSPLLAVLLGLGVGLGVALLLLRSRLLEGLSGILARGRAEQAAKEPTATAFADTDEWLQTEEGLDAEALPIGPPAEQTYIVEVTKGADTAGLESTDLEIPVTDGTAIFAGSLAPPDEAVESAPGAGEPAEIEAMGAAAEAPQQPGTVDDQTATGLPAIAAESEPPATPAVDFDPTVETDMAELFADELSELPAEPDLPVTAFAGSEEDPLESPVSPTAKMPQFETSTDAPVDSPAAALDNPGTDGEAAATPDLEGLPAEESAEDSQLSNTLQEALTMLETDYGDDLTASQIIDQSGMKRMLESGEADADPAADEVETPPKTRAS